MTISAFVYLACEWILRIAMLIEVTRRRHPPAAATSWLVVVFFLPLVGFLLYLLIGTSKLPKRRIARHSRLASEFDRLIREHAAEIASVRPQLGQELEATVALALNLGQMPILGGNHAELMSRNEEVINALIGDIDAAVHHVHLLFYIFAADATGRRVGDALIRATRRGIACRVMADSVGSSDFFKRLAEPLRNEGVEVVEALEVGIFRRRAARIDLRNHRKIAVIDGQIAYTGSQNICDPCYGHNDLSWHDVMCRVRGPVVLALQAVFAADWFFETEQSLHDSNLFPDPPTDGPIAIQVLPSGPNYPMENYQCMVVTAIHGARERVVITTPYFIPDEPFLHALKIAVLRGVRVDLVVPFVSDQFLVGRASESYFEELLEAGIRVHRYSAGLLHAKSMSIDGDLAFVGTSNFDIRSFALNFEVNLVLYGAGDPVGLRKLQADYIAGSAEVEPAIWALEPQSRTIVRNLVRLMSPLL